MDSARRASTVAGVLFVVATAASVGASALMPAVTGADYLTGVANNPHRLAAAALLYLLAAGTSGGIAIALYPALRPAGAATAVGSVIFRAIEAVFYASAVVFLLSLMPLSDQFTTGPAANRASIQALADAVVTLRDHASLVGVFAFTVGAAMYYVLFFRSRLIPRWLSGWGVAGVALMLIACCLALFTDSAITGYTLLILPIAIQELVLAAWLVVKGFAR